MMYPKVKVYHDGTHYVGNLKKPVVPPKPKRDSAKKREEWIERISQEAIEESKKVFSYSAKQKKIKQALIDKGLGEQEASILAVEVTDKEMRNLIERRKRFCRKAYLNKFNYFCTFTYDDKKYTEDKFKKALIKKLSKLQKKYGWRYMGIWERSPQKERLHFHGLLFIPEGTMMGELIKVKDYNFKTHSVKETVQNTYFNKKFGRSDFEEIHPLLLPRALTYILKYLTKTNDKIVYSKNIPNYVLSDIDYTDVLCQMEGDEFKVVLDDHFTCWDEGEYIGEISDDIKQRLGRTK